MTRGPFAPSRSVSSYCLTRRGWLGAERDAADPAGDDREVEYNQGMATVKPRSGGTLTKEHREPTVGGTVEEGRNLAGAVHPFRGEVPHEK